MSDQDLPSPARTDVRELFAQLVAARSHFTIEEQTDAQLDALVAYAVRAVAAADRAAKEFNANRPLVRPMPTGVPPAARIPPPSTSLLDRLFR